MASFCRSAAFAAARSTAFRSKSALPKHFPSRKPPPFLSRPVYAALEVTGSLMPLHSAVASARLKSFIAADSSYWCGICQGLKEDN